VSSALSYHHTPVNQDRWCRALRDDGLRSWLPDRPAPAGSTPGDDLMRNTPIRRARSSSHQPNYLMVLKERRLMSTPHVSIARWATDKSQCIRLARKSQGIRPSWNESGRALCASGFGRLPRTRLSASGDCFRAAHVKIFSRVCSHSARRGPMIFRPARCLSDSGNGVCDYIPWAGCPPEASGDARPTRRAWARALRRLCVRARPSSWFRRQRRTSGRRTAPTKRSRVRNGLHRLNPLAFCRAAVITALRKAP